MSKGVLKCVQIAEKNKQKIMNKKIYEKKETSNLWV